MSVGFQSPESIQRVKMLSARQIGPEMFLFLAKNDEDITDSSFHWPQVCYLMCNVKKRCNPSLLVEHWLVLFYRREII